MKNCVTGGRNIIMIKIKVKVIPNKPKFKIEKTGTHHKIYLQNPPEKGKANLELIKKLSKKLNTEVKIISGHNSRTKLLQINLTREEFEDKVSKMRSGS